jgi:TPR repeat protein
VTGLFAANPFPGRPPAIVRIRLYCLRFTTPAVLRSSGRYWIKSYREDLFPMVGAVGGGRIVECGLEPVEAALRDGNSSAALEACKALYARGCGEAGVRLAMLYERGIGLEAGPERAAALYRELADRGYPSAQAHLGACYEAGAGVAPDPSLAASWYATGASHGSALGLYGLGGLYAKGWAGPGGDQEGLTLVIEARARARGTDPDSLRIRRDEAGYEAQLSARLGSAGMAAAHREAARRVSADDPLGRGP